MALVEHLRELRRRVIISVLALLAGTILGFIWYAWSPPGVQTLGEIMRGPYCSLPQEMRADFSNDGECRLLATSPFEMFLLRMKVGALAGLVVSSPVWLYQIWAFITPGLHKGERRWTMSFVAIAVTLFVAGALLAYFIIDIGLEFLLTIGEEAQIAALTGGQYYNFVLALIVIFGVSFELPLIIMMLNIVGLLHYDAIQGKRSYVVIGVFIFAALLTPGGEPFSMLIMAVAVNILVELSFQFVRFNDKRTGYDEIAGWSDLDDEEASELDYTPDAVERAAPIAGGGSTPASASPRPSAGPAPSRQDDRPAAGPAAQESFGPGTFDDVL
nr:twin-arginine translocase subunit TatC [Corynebacterium guangdongense]